MKPAEIYTQFLGKDAILTGACVSLKFQHKPPYQRCLHIYADPPCHGHWWFFSSSARRRPTSIFPQTSWNVESSEHETRCHCLAVHLRRASVQRPFLLHIDVWLPLCVIQFQGAFPDASRFNWITKLQLYCFVFFRKCNFLLLRALKGSYLYHPEPVNQPLFSCLVLNK